MGVTVMADSFESYMADSIADLRKEIMGCVPSAIEDTDEKFIWFRLVEWFCQPDNPLPRELWCGGLFEKLDASYGDRTGRISYENLKRAVEIAQGPEIFRRGKTYLDLPTSYNLTDGVMKAINFADMDGDGVINLDEFTVVFEAFSEASLEHSEVISEHRRRRAACHVLVSPSTLDALTDDLDCVREQYNTHGQDTRVLRDFLNELGLAESASAFENDLRVTEYDDLEYVVAEDLAEIGIRGPKARRSLASCQSYEECE